MSRESSRSCSGALKVVSRETLDDARFRIIYRGHFRDDWFADVVSDWLRKHGEEAGLVVQPEIPIASQFRQ